MARISLKTLLSRGIRLKCPKCGKGKLFKSYLKSHKKCPNCRLKLEGGYGQDAPSYFLMWLIVTVVPISALVVEAKFEPDPWVHVVLWVPLTFAMTLGLLPVFKGLWIGLEYRHKTSKFK